MCGGYELDADPEALISAFSVQAWRPGLGEELRTLAPEHFPRMRGPIVLTQRPSSEQPHATRWLGLSRWGLVPPWARSVAEGDKMYNARAETLLERPAFRDAFLARRCVVPVTAFYEWRRAGQRSERFVLRPQRTRFAALAGLWALWRGPSGERVGSYTVITVAPNQLVAPIHDRMPALLASPEAVERWLALDASPDELSGLLRPADLDALGAEPG